MNSTGRRNTSSVEVSDGQAFGLDDDADGATDDALTGVYTHPSRCGTGVLGQDPPGPAGQDRGEVSDFSNHYWSVAVMGPMCVAGIQIQAACPLGGRNERIWDAHFGVQHGVKGSDGDGRVAGTGACSRGASCASHSPYSARQPRMVPCTPAV